MTIYQVSQAQVAQYEASGKTTVTVLKGTATFISVAMTCAMIVASLIPIVYNNSYWWLQFPVAGGIFLNFVFIQPQIAKAVERREGIFKAHRKLIQLKNEKLSTPTKAELPAVDQRFKSDRLDQESKRAAHPQSAKHLQRVVDIYDLAVRPDIVKVKAAARLAKPSQTTTADKLRDIKTELQEAQKDYLSDMQKIYVTFQGELTEQQQKDRGDAVRDAYEKFEGNLRALKHQSYFLSSNLMKKHFGVLVTDDEKFKKDFNSDVAKRDKEIQQKREEYLEKAKTIIEPKELEKFILDCGVEILKIENEYAIKLGKLNETLINKKITEICEIVKAHKNFFQSELDNIYKLYNKGNYLYGPLKEFSNPPPIKFFEKQLEELRVTDFNPDMTREPHVILDDLQESHFIARIEFERLREIQFKNECQAWLERHPGVRLNYIRAQLNQTENALMHKDSVEEALELNSYDEKLTKLSDAYYALVDEPNEAGYKALIKQIKELQTAVNIFYLKTVKGTATNFFSHVWQTLTKKNPEKPSMPFAMDVAYFKEFDAAYLPLISLNPQPGFEEFSRERKDLLLEISSSHFEEFFREREVFLEGLGQDPKGTVIDLASAYKAKNLAINDQINEFLLREDDFEKLHRRLLRLIDREKFFMLRTTIDANLNTMEKTNKLELVDEWHKLLKIKESALYRKKVIRFGEKLGIRKENLPLVPPAFKKAVDSHLNPWQSLQVQYDWDKIVLLCNNLGSSPFEALNKDVADLVAKQKEWVEIQKYVNLDEYNGLVSSFLQKWEAPQELKKEWEGITKEPDIQLYRSKVEAFVNKYKVDDALLKQGQNLLVRGNEFYKNFKIIPVHLVKKIEELQMRGQEIPSLWAEIQNGFDWDKVVALCEKLNLSPLGSLKEDIEKVFAMQKQWAEINQEAISFKENGTLFLTKWHMPLEIKEQWGKINQEDAASILAFIEKIREFFAIQNRSLMAKQTQWEEIQKDGVLNDKISRFLAKWKMVEIGIEWDGIANAKIRNPDEHAKKIEAFNKKVLDILAMGPHSEDKLQEWDKIQSNKDYKVKVADFLARWNIPDGQVKDHFEAQTRNLRAVEKEWNELRAKLNHKENIAQFLTKWQRSPVSMSDADLAQLRILLSDKISFYQSAKIMPSELLRHMLQLKKDWEITQASKTEADYKKSAEAIGIKEPATVVSEQRRKMINAQGQLRKIDGSYVTIAQISRGVLRGVIITALLIVEWCLSSSWVPFGIVCALTVIEGVTYLLERHMVSLEKKKTALKIEEYLTCHKNHRPFNDAPAFLHENRRTA